MSFKAPRAAVYRPLLDPSAIEKWKVPDGMSCRVHYFDARVGGEFRISLTYDRPTGTGKTTARTDTYRGRFDHRARIVHGPPSNVRKVCPFSEPALLRCGGIVDAAHPCLPPLQTYAAFAPAQQHR